MTAACGSDDTDTASTGSRQRLERRPPRAPRRTPATRASTRPRTWSAPAAPTTPKAVPDGAGSVAGMAQDPVAVAASNNPLLKTLTAAVSGQLNPDVNLVDTLNGDEFTVFAPVDEAFAAIPKKTVTTLSKDADAAVDDPDLPRRPRPDRSRGHRGHADHRPGRGRRGHRLRRQPQGQRRLP